MNEIAEVIPVTTNYIDVMLINCEDAKTHSKTRLTMTDAEAVYRYIQRRYQMLDAEEHIADLIEEYENDEAFEKAYGVTPAEAASPDVYAMCTDKFVDLSDCNRDENSTWMSAIEEVLEDMARERKRNTETKDSSAEAPTPNATQDELDLPVFGEKCSIETPLGEIVVFQSGFTADGYPGFIIDLRRKGCKATAPLAMVEFTPTEGDLDNSAIITRVWDNVCEDEYQTRVIHSNLDKFFNEQD